MAKDNKAERRKDLKRLVDLREEHDWTQAQVAMKINVSQRAYSHYENGTRELPLGALCDLAGLYNTSTDYILGLTDIKVKYAAGTKGGAKPARPTTPSVRVTLPGGNTPQDMPPLKGPGA